MNNYTISSGNIFKDLVFPNAEEHFLKVELASEIAHIIHQKNLTPSEVINLLKIELDKVRDLNNGQLDEFYQEDFLFYLIALE